jgi:hypothetical protein
VRLVIVVCSWGLKGGGGGGEIEGVCVWKGTYYEEPVGEDAGVFGEVGL